MEPLHSSFLISIKYNDIKLLTHYIQICTKTVNNLNHKDLASVSKVKFFKTNFLPPFIIMRGHAVV
jgi:hypothetical protein